MPDIVYPYAKISLPHDYSAHARRRLFKVHCKLGVGVAVEHTPHAAVYRADKQPLVEVRKIAAFKPLLLNARVQLERYAQQLERGVRNGFAAVKAFKRSRGVFQPEA